ncbi:helix-turn-helix domain-containing protein [Streptomyces sp. NPDC051572]|uniref:helix-turn-helix domain-containing protein n=1 Tax=Streptomyces sp. NPDC051572 TaxID=3155802 RepID=UPI00344BC99B
MGNENSKTTNQTATGWPQLLTVREAHTLLRISKWKLYDLIRTHLLETVRIGRRRFIPVEGYRAYVERLRQRESFA